MPSLLLAQTLSKVLIGFKPDWPAPFFVRALMTTRRGGVSQAPWDELNLGLFAGDDSTCVQKNRALLEREMGVPAAYLRQVHGSEGVAIDLNTSPATQADVAWTTQSGIACAMMAADCLPILVCHPTEKWVAAAHAGWRGLAGKAGHGVVETLAHAAKAQGLKTEDCLVWLGPCIGPTAFEVGSDVVDAFEPNRSADSVSDQPEALSCFQPKGSGKFLADLAGLARSRLQSLGFGAVYGNDSSLPWCTFTQKSDYHSHRRDAVTLGGAGRMAAYIWITA